MREARERAEGERTLSAGVLVFRWGAFVWMTVLALTSAQPFARPGVAAAVLGGIGAWTAWLTLTRADDEPVRWADLAIGAGLMFASAVAVERGAFLRGSPFFVIAYPVAAVLSWGAARGPVAGLAAGAGMGIALVLSRPINGVALAALGAPEIQGLANSTVIFLAAGAAMGVMRRVLDRSAREVREANERALEAREQAARLAERESLARRIHDSVLQSLAMIHKRGRELAASDPVPQDEVRALAGLAAEQEEQLRSLIVRDPEPAPEGMASLRLEIEAVARGRALPVDVSAVGPVWMPAARAGEAAAAVRQAIENVEAHAAAARATVHVVGEGGEVRISIRDDGRGFTYDEEALRAAGKLGMLSSMKGRIEDLGGAMRVDTALGRGTEIELRLPAEAP